MIENNSLIDSNILIYAYDLSEKTKNPIANKILKEAMEQKYEISLSTQNLSEFYFNATQKINPPIPKSEAAEIMKELTSFDNFHILKINSSTILKAINISIEYNLHYWDALIAATMQENSVFTIITENDKDFKKILWLTVKNPFK